MIPAVTPTFESRIKVGPLNSVQYFDYAMGPAVKLNMSKEIVQNLSGYRVDVSLIVDPEINNNIVNIIQNGIQSTANVPKYDKVNKCLIFNLKINPQAKAAIQQIQQNSFRLLFGIQNIENSEKSFLKFSNAFSIQEIGVWTVGENKEEDHS